MQVHTYPNPSMKPSDFLSSHELFSGMLAASRLYGAYTRAIDTLVHKEDETGEDGDFKETPEQQRREAQGEFPDLNIDT